MSDGCWETVVSPLYWWYNLQHKIMWCRGVRSSFSRMANQGILCTGMLSVQRWHNKSVLAPIGTFRWSFSLQHPVTFKLWTNASNPPSVYENTQSSEVSTHQVMGRKSLMVRSWDIVVYSRVLKAIPLLLDFVNHLQWLSQSGDDFLPDWEVLIPSAFI